jgi:hypothetical protein
VVTLGIIVTVVAVLAVLGAVLAARPAPAVSLALVAGLAGGSIAYVVARGNGTHGVPASVARGFSAGVALGGLIGLVVSRRRKAGTWHMRRDAVWLLVVTPFAAAALLLAIFDACPLYVTEGAGLCFYDVDLMGGWAAEAAFLFVLDMVILATLLWLSPGPRRAA